MLTRRLQILIDEERYHRVAGRARRRGVSVATVIREAIDRAFPPAARRRARAAEKILSAEAMPVPEDPRELRREVDETRSPRW